MPSAGQSICVVILLSLSPPVLTVTQSVRPSLSQLARFGLAAESRKNLIFQHNIFLVIILYSVLLCSNLCYTLNVSLPHGFGIL